MSEPAPLPPQIDSAANLKFTRSPPIPKEVNQYVLEHFGAAYYNSSDFAERHELLKNIETQLAQSGYRITAGGIERRLKNMKSHYRRKKADLQRGNSSRVDWQYYEILQKIFNEQDEVQAASEAAPKIAENSIAALPQKRKRVRRAPQPIQPAPAAADQAVEFDDQPQDLSVKRPKVEEEEQQPAGEPKPPAQVVDDDPSQPLSYLSAFISNQVQANQESYHKILDGLRAINEHRSVLSEQIRHLESRRQELDNLGLELTNFLIIFQQIDARENLGLYK